MSDLLSTLQSRGTLSINDLAAAMNCTITEALEAIHLHWWEAEQIAGPSGWLYRIRPVISTTKRMAREVRKYINVGISPSGPKGHIL